MKYLRPLSLPACVLSVSLIGSVELMTACSRATATDRQTKVSQDASAQSGSKETDRSPQQFGLAENMPYEDARNLLLQQGWEPHTTGDAPNLNDSTVSELVNLGYPEVKDCAGTGLGPCRFEFMNEAGEVFVVSTIQNGSDSNRERFVWGWFFEQSASSSEDFTAPSDTAFILDGYYVLGGTDQGLQVLGDRYRYYDERGEYAWQLLLDLTPIEEGVVFDGDNYWCIPLTDEAGVCTENGWQSV